MLKLVQVLQKNGLSQRKLAQMVDISEITLSKLIQGKLFPYPGWKKKLGEALGIDPEILFQEVKQNDDNPITDGN